MRYFGNRKSFLFVILKSGGCFGDEVRSFGEFDVLKIGVGRGDIRENKWGGSKKLMNVCGYGIGRIFDWEVYSWGKYEVDDGIYRKFKGVWGKCMSMGYFYIFDIGLE